LCRWVENSPEIGNGKPQESAAAKRKSRKNSRQQEEEILRVEKKAKESKGGGGRTPWKAWKGKNGLITKKQGEVKQSLDNRFQGAEEKDDGTT